MAENALLVLSGHSVPDLIELGKRAIQEAGSFAEVKAIRDQAEAMRVYQRSVKAGREAVNAATEIRIRAERRMGEELARTEKNVGGRPEKTPSEEEGVSPPTLDEYGISYRESHDWQQLAKPLPEQLDAVIEAAGDTGLITGAKVQRLAKAAVERAWSPADIRRAARDEALGGVELPSPGEARRRAAAASAERGDGTVLMVVGSDAKAHGPPLTPEQDRLRERWHRLDDLMRALDDCAGAMDPARAAGCVPHHMRPEFGPWLARAAGYIAGLAASWEKRHAA